MSTAPPAPLASKDLLATAALFWIQRGYSAQAPWPVLTSHLFPLTAGTVIPAEVLPIRTIWWDTKGLHLLVVCRPGDLEREWLTAISSCREEGLGSGTAVAVLDLESAERRARKFRTGRLSDYGTWYGQSKKVSFTTSSRGRTTTRRQAEPVASLGGYLSF